MKFMTANERAATAERSVGEKPRGAVAEMKLSSGKARRVPEQTGHRVALSGSVLEALAEHHVAAAFAVDRTCFGEPPQSRCKCQRGREHIRVQFRIAAGQPAAIGVFRRRLVGERRERQNFGTGVAPGIDDVRIDETEGAIAGERDALAWRWQRGGARAGPRLQVRGACRDGVEIEVAFRHAGKALNQRGEIRMLAGLNEAEMPLGQRQRGLARDRSHYRNTQRGDRAGHQRPMPFACDAVEDHARDPHPRIVRGKSPDQSGG